MLQHLISLLVRKGASVFALDDSISRLTPLHYGARAGHVEVVKALLKAGAPSDAIDAHGDTPLHWYSMVLLVWLEAEKLNP